MRVLIVGSDRYLRTLPDEFRCDSATEIIAGGGQQRRFVGEAEIKLDNEDRVVLLQHGPLRDASEHRFPDRRSITAGDEAHVRSDVFGGVENGRYGIAALRHHVNRYAIVLETPRCVFDLFPRHHRFQYLVVLS